MSIESEKALALVTSGRLDDAGRLAVSAVQQDPDDWHAHYVTGQYFRFVGD